VRFRGPVPAHILKDLSNWNSVGALLSQRREDDGQDPRQISTATPELRLDGVVVRRFIMQGRIWSGFEASGVSTRVLESAPSEHEMPGSFPASSWASASTPASSFSSPPSSSRDPELLKAGSIPLVAKFSAPKDHLVDTEGVVAEIYREAFVYEHLLQHLQGSVVPLHYGTYFAWQSSRGGTPASAVLSCILQDAGEALGAVGESWLSHVSEADKWVPASYVTDFRIAILEKYEALHSAGVIHVSTGPKHWLRRGPGKEILLIDFGNSLLRPSEEVALAGLDMWNDLRYSAEEWAEAAAMEMNEVRTMLGMETVLHPVQETEGRRVNPLVEVEVVPDGTGDGDGEQDSSETAGENE